MIIYLMTKNSLITFPLPIDVDGNYWIQTPNISKTPVNILNIKAQDAKWVMSVSNDYILFDNGQPVENTDLLANKYYYLRNQLTNETVIVFPCDLNTDSLYYDIREINELYIGSDPKCSISFSTNLISPVQAQILRTTNGFKITNLVPDKLPIFVNGIMVEDKQYLHYGDVVFIVGLRIILLNDILIVNDLKTALLANLKHFDIKLLFEDIEDVEDDDANVTVYQKKDYFNRAPRFRSLIEPLKMKVSNPPQNPMGQDLPFLLTVGPMMTMGTTSGVMMYTSLNNAISSGRGISSAIPQLIMSGAMLCSMLLWPLVTRAYKKHKLKKANKIRIKKYKEYIDSLRQEISVNITRQRQILLENHISAMECVQIITNRSSKLWERKIDEDDFMVVRLGLGVVPLEIDIKYPEEEFSLDEDELKPIFKELFDETHDIPGAPVTISLLKKKVTGVIGNHTLSAQFVKGILLQLLAFYAPNMLKVVVLTSNDKASEWNWIKELNHNWDDDKENRFFATNSDELKEVLNYLDKVYEARSAVLSGNNNQSAEELFKLVTPYYFIICDNYEMIADNNFIKKITNPNFNAGFSILMFSKMISTLPNECNCFININADVSGVIENELVTGKQKEFITEFPTEEFVEASATVLANIPVQNESKSKGLPDSCGLLEMYNVGRVEALNSLSRWKQNDPTVSLASPIGIDANGGLFKLDLHEKFHGPHGLVAGMTGSGKSEFIITFVLSMAINYHPDEVAFVLIDYKGGGLALAFENKELGIRLPHIAGTITNLDVNELNRALASIEAELKRRQREFNKARDISGESTIDIYKYQRLYREGVVKTPIPHLFLISDEFAELKAQQPEFMDQLISTARIGRSLGVHLILATQKPSGVVNDQIWSNSKFKVCLKVQDKADSKDMIQVPDAAELKNVGRFYLLVGYNDYFAMGQSAYCGMPYIPSDTIQKSIDTTLNFVNNVGNTIKSIDDVKTVEAESQGEVLLNVVKYLSAIAQKENIKVNKLWLDKIPEQILVDDLIQKYTYQTESYNINPIIGEYDDPSTQSQHLLTLNLNEKGNTIVYGRTGSGKEELLATLLYSTMIYHSPKEVNFYVIDCGAETLRQFRNAPQIGDVILSNENEKMLNLFSMLNNMLVLRKKNFADYGGDISTYNSQVEEDKKQAYTVVLINGFENFFENYQELDESLSKLTREGTKYGIIFVITCSSLNAVKLKIKQNFNNQISLQLIDYHDYISIFGPAGKMVPANCKGRGLVQESKVYEFQTASICDIEQRFSILKNVSDKLNEIYAIKAPKVPVLPDIVDLDEVKNKITDLSAVPIGVEKESLDICTFDFQERGINLIGTANIKNAAAFIKEFWKVLLNIPNLNVVFLDAANSCKSPIENSAYYKDNFNDVITTINSYLDNPNPPTDKDYLVMISGIDNLLTTLDLTIANTFKEALRKVKNNKHIRVILIDTPDSFKKYQMDLWWTDNIKKEYAVWIGKGISDQILIKTDGASFKMLSTPIKNDMGYAIVDTMPVLIKLLQELEQDK